MWEHIANSAQVQVSAQFSSALADRLYEFLRPLLFAWHTQLDRRLVQTFLSSVSALLTHRHRNLGLVLSELGAYLAGPAHAPAGTKLLSRLLHVDRGRRGGIPVGSRSSPGDRPSRRP